MSRRSPVQIVPGAPRQIRASDLESDQIVDAFKRKMYAIMTASPRVAGWNLDCTGAPDGAILFEARLFALVLPAAVLFRILKNGAIAAAKRSARSWR